MTIKKLILVHLFTLCALLLISENVYSQYDLQKIVSNVQENTSKMNNSIKSIRFSGISKTYFYTKSEAIGMDFFPETEQYYFEGYWIEPDSIRIIITALRRTKATHPLVVDTNTKNPDYLNIINKSYPIPDPFSSSNVSVLGLNRKNRIKNKTTDTKEKSIWPIYPFSIGAEKFYNYELRGNVRSNYTNVIHIFVSTKDNNVPGLTGIFQIDPLENIVVGSDVEFNEAARLLKEGSNSGMKSPATKSYIPISIYENHTSKTKKMLVNSAYWLPETQEENFTLNLFGMNLSMRREINFLSYSINSEQDNKLNLENKKVSYDIDVEKEKLLLNGSNDPNKLSSNEVDSLVKTMKLNDLQNKVDINLFDMPEVAQYALKNKLGYNNNKYFSLSKAWGQNIKYNRVEGLSLNYGLSLTNMFFDNNILVAKVEYGFKDQLGKYTIGTLIPLTSGNRFFLEGSIYKKLNYNNDFQSITDEKNTFTGLLFGHDYRDYYYTNGGKIGLGLKLSNSSVIKLSYIDQLEKKAFQNTNFSLFNHNSSFKDNPKIQEGVFKGFRTEYLYRKVNFEVKLVGEYTDNKNLKSDFTYTLFKSDIRWDYKINNMNNLNILLSTGFIKKSSPSQKWFDFGGKSLFSYSNKLRGIEYNEFTGDNFYSGIINYELLNGDIIDPIPRKNIVGNILKYSKIMIWAGIAKSTITLENIVNSKNINTPINTTNGVYKEFGISIADQLNIFRIDFVYNTITKNNLKFGVNFFR